MANILTELGTAVTQYITWAGNVGTAIISSDLAMLFVGMTVTGFAFGLFGRLLNRS